MRPSVDDVHHRYGKHVGVGPAHVAVQGHLDAGCGGLGHGEGHPQHGVGAKPRLVVGPVKVQQHEVDDTLVECVKPNEDVTDLALHVRNGRRHALAAPRSAAVAQLVGLELPRGGTRGDDGAPHVPGLDVHLNLDGRVASGVDHLPGVDVFDDAHVYSFRSRGQVRTATSRRNARGPTS